MTKRPSLPSSKPASRTAGGGKVGASAKTHDSPMNNFNRLAKGLTEVSREQLGEAEAEWKLEQSAKKRAALKRKLD